MSHGEHGSTTMPDVRGLLWASEQNVVAARLGRQPGVLRLEINPVAQTATVVFDPARTSLADLRRWVRECGYHCTGQWCLRTSAIRRPSQPRRPARRGMPARRRRLNTGPSQRCQPKQKATPAVVRHRRPRRRR